MSDNIKIEIDGGERLLIKLKKMGIASSAVLEAAVRAGARILEQEAEPNAPGPHLEIETVEKGRDSVTVAVGPDEDHWYYRFFETGTPPHKIAGSPLVFEAERGKVYAKEVHHPGMAARPFLRPAVDAKKGAAEKAIGARLKAAVEGVAK